MSRCGQVQTTKPIPPPPAGSNGESHRQAVTGLLRAIATGDVAAREALFRHVYDELRRMAHRVRGGGAGETLTTTALVHEAYLKLFGATGSDWEGRAHFFGAAARAMRQILVDAARHRLRRKRGGRDAWQVTLDDEAQAAPVRAEEIVALDEALERLAALDPRQAQVVEQRFFAGMTAEETAHVLGISVPTVHRDWRAARTWLWREMHSTPRDAP